MAYKFTIKRESIKREFSVYVVIAKFKETKKLYVGKTGDNRAGCNPLISRAGNHFSYNKIHSQIRNKINKHEDCEYIYVFDHFYKYNESDKKRKEYLNNINEIERWLNEEVQKIIKIFDKCELLNPYSGKSISKEENKKRDKIRKKLEDGSEKEKIDRILQEIKSILN